MKQKTIEVIAPAFFGGSRRRPGDRLTVPADTKGSWFTEAKELPAAPTGGGGRRSAGKADAEANAKAGDNDLV